MQLPGTCQQGYIGVILEIPLTPQKFSINISHVQSGVCIDIELLQVANIYSDIFKPHLVPPHLHR